MLGAIGMGSSFSVTTAIAIGLISLVVLVLFSLTGVWLFLRRGDSAASAVIEPKNAGIEWTSFTALLIAMSTSVMIFFQVRVATEGGAITANVSDLIALTALGLTALLILRHRNFSIFPKLFSLGLVAISVALAVALVIGWSRYGLNQWAIVNRGFGWIIILGYLAVGAALVWADKTNGRVLVLWSFALAGASVAGLELGLLVLYQVPLITTDAPIHGVRST